ncbi:MAG: hypothetical protein SVR08_01560 [Spirochaetota bacterium]|nr:hypothetical protein [Spirochaetota bacterium]
MVTSDKKRKSSVEKIEEKEGKKRKVKKNETVIERSLIMRIMLKSLKIMFIWLPLSIIILVIIALFALKIYLSPERVENLITSNFNQMSYGNISLNVKKFSPYSGFEIEKIVIRNGKEFARTKFVEIDKLIVRYGLFSMLIGDIRFDEIGIYNPRIYLKEKKGIWNAVRLMKPGKPEPVDLEEKVEEVEQGPPLKEINLPISASLLFKFILKDLKLYIDGESYRSSIEGLTFGIDISVPPFKRIPISIEAVSLLKKMIIELNPKGKVDIAFSSKDAEIDHPLILSWKLIFGRAQKGRPKFLSNFRLGTYKTPVRFKDIHLAPLSFKLSYDIIYDPISDNLKLNHLKVSFRNNNWIDIAGSVKSVTKIPKIDIQMTESAIVLDDLYPYFLNFTGDRKTKFNGLISLYPLSIKGDTENIDIIGQVNLKEIGFKNPSIEAVIPHIQLSYSISKIKDDMNIATGINIPHLLYTLDKNKSGDNGLDLGIKILSSNNFERVIIDKFSFRFFNPEIKKDALNILINGDVRLKPDMAGKIRIKRLLFMKDPLLGMLPNNIKESLVPLPFSKPVNMNLDLDFSMSSAEINAVLGMLIKVPDYNVNDLKIGLNIVQDSSEKRVTLNNFNMNSKTYGLSIKAKGTIDTKSPPFSDSDLKLLVKLDYPKMRPIYGPWNISGLIQLAASMNGDLKTGKASGSIEIDRLFVKNEESMISVEDMNLDFPFEYYFTPQYKGGSRILIDKTQVIDNDKFKERENFTISSIKAKHPARDISFEFLKDFSATMFFRNNTFEIIKLRAYILDGSLYGRDILFNLADMNIDNFEYRLILDLPNVDIEKLDDPNPKQKTRKAELSLNANFKGKGLDFSKKLNVKGYINIYKIGEKFANRLLKGLNSEKGESKLGIAQYVVDNTMKVDGLNYNLDKGLVYVTVGFSRRRPIGYIIGIERDIVKYDRIPIQEYLRGIMKGEMK